MSSGFVSTTELTEERQRRQDEWEKVRKPDDPVTAPEPEVCNKTLFEQLRDNKEAKDMEVAEAKKMKNMIRGIDEDESDFLSHVDNIKANMQRKKAEEEKELLREVAEARGQIIEPPTVAQIIKIAPPANSAKSKQASILSSAIKRKSTVEDSASSSKIAKEDKGEVEAKLATSALKVIGCIPGIGDYEASSDSNSSDSDEEIETLPILKITRPQKKQDDEDHH